MGRLSKFATRAVGVVSVAVMQLYNSCVHACLGHAQITCTETLQDLSVVVN